MKNKRQYLYVLLLFCLSTVSAHAQKQFTEGVLTYSVIIDPPGNQEGLVQIKGTYTITVKGDNVRKDLVMENGFGNTNLVTNKKMYILRDMGKKKFAIEMDKEHMVAQNAIYKNFSLEQKKKTKTIAGMKAHAAIITYKNGNSREIYYTDEWVPYERLFDKFPSINVMPVIFEYKNEDGTVMHFQLEKIEQKPLENSIFHIESSYKIMTHEEYNKMSK